VAELDRILDTISEWSQRDVRFALATVVGVRGSTYRGLTARQLISSDGTSVGTVSGGCLDSDLHAVAAEVIATSRAQLVEFDLTADDEAVWGWGIGCNGATEVLVEPSAPAVELARAMADLFASHRPAALVHTLTGGIPGSRAIVTHGGVTGSLSSEMAAEARALLGDGRHGIVEVGGVRALVEVTGTRSRLIVCGAGHDAVPVVRYGAELGFEVIVVDDRRQFLTRERFPQASALVHCEPRELGSAVDLDHRAHVVLMSHNYLRDVEYLRSALHGDPAYVGVLGPGERLRRLLHDVRSMDPEIRVLDRLFGPAGLDIGAEGPVEIAWAIMAEILAVRRGTVGGHLRSRKGPAELKTPNLMVRD